MGYVAAVPEAIAAGATVADLIVALGAFLLWVVCLGLLWGWDYTFGAMLRAVASVLDFRVWKFSVRLGAPLIALDHSVRVALSKGVSSADHAMGLFFHWAGVLVAWMANFAMQTAQDTLHLARWLTGVHLPRYVKWAARAAFPLAWLTKLIAQEIAKALPKVGRLTRYIVHESTTVVTKLPRALDRRLSRAEKRIVALAAAVAGLGAALPFPHDFPTPGKVWRGLTKRLARLERRMARMERLLGVAAMAAAIANVLGLPNWRCLTRGNIGRTARALCGIPAHLLDDFLGLLADVWILENVCTLLPLLEEAASAVGVPMVEALTSVGAGLCAGHKAPAVLRGPRASTPAVIFAAVEV